MQEEKFPMMKFIKQICEEIGPRLCTSENEYAAGLKIKKILESQADKVILEEFSCHPQAFLDFTKVAFVITCLASGILIASVFISYASFWFSFISFLLYLYGITIFLFEQMYLKEYVDFFFPQRTGTNVIGKLNAARERKKIVICSAHHDSAYEFPLFEKYKSKFGLLAYFTVSTIIFSAIFAILKGIFDLLTYSSFLLNSLSIGLPVLSLIMVGYLAFNLHSKNVILGAQDNLSGVAVVLGLAQYFSAHRLQNIELWLISFSCEECMRGSKRFVEKHYEELVDSITINFDMVGKGEISIISAEPYFTAKHSLELAKDFQKISNFPIRVVHFGGTDAASFSKKKLKAISIMGLTPDKYPHTWHTLSDTPEIIEEELLENTLQATIKFLLHLDSSL
ncbi:MAG: M28 family metallopeptidase [Candidatus Helarchaeota archaeon]